MICVPRDHPQKFCQKIIVTPDYSPHPLDFYHYHMFSATKIEEFLIFFD